MWVHLSIHNWFLYLFRSLYAPSHEIISLHLLFPTWSDTKNNHYMRPNPFPKALCWFCRTRSSGWLTETKFHRVPVSSTWGRCSLLQTCCSVKPRGGQCSSSYHTNGQRWTLRLICSCLCTFVWVNCKFQRFALKYLNPSTDGVILHCCCCFLFRAESSAEDAHNSPDRQAVSRLPVIASNLSDFGSTWESSQN